MSEKTKSEDVEGSQSSGPHSINIAQNVINPSVHNYFDAIPQNVLLNQQGQVHAQTQEQSLVVSLKSDNPQDESQYIFSQENNILYQKKITQVKEDEDKEKITQVKEDEDKEKKTQVKEDEDKEKITQVKEDEDKEKITQVKEDEDKEKITQVKEDEDKEKKAQVNEVKNGSEEKEKHESKSRNKSREFLLVDEENISKMGNNIHSLSNNIDSLVLKIDESLVVAKKTNENLNSLVGEAKITNKNLNSLVLKMDESIGEAKKTNENLNSLLLKIDESLSEAKKTNEKTLNEIKALNQNQVRLLEILAGKFATQNNGADQNNNKNN